MHITWNSNFGSSLRNVLASLQPPAYVIANICITHAAAKAATVWVTLVSFVRGTGLGLGGLCHELHDLLGGVGHGVAGND